MQVLSKTKDKGGDTAANNARHIQANQTIPFDKNFTDDLPILIWQCDATLHIKYLNPLWEKITGRTIAELCQMKFSEIISPENVKAIQAVLTPEGTAHQAHVVVDVAHTGGSATTVNLLCSHVHKSEDNSIVYGGIASLLERKESRTIGSDSETTGREFDNEPGAVIEINTAGRIVYVNPAWTLVTGYTEEQSLGTRFCDRIHPDDLDEYAAAMFDLLGKRKSFYRKEMRFSAASGNFCWLEGYAQPIQNDDEVVVGIRTYFTDITKRIAAEDALRASEVKYRALSDATLEAVFISENGKFLEQNLTAIRMFGYSDEEAVDKSGDLLVIPADRERVIKNILSDYREPYEVTALRKDGTTFPCEIQGKTFTYLGRQVRISALRDITRQKQTQAALQESETKYRAIFENIQDIYYRADVEGRLIEISPSLARYTGYSREEVIGKSIVDMYIDSEERTGLLQRLSEKGELIDYTVRLRRKNGDTIFTSVNVHYLFDSDGQMTGLEGVLRDVTERKYSELKMQRQLSFSKALNQLSATIIEETEASKLLQRLVAILGQTLQVDRALLYEVSFRKNLAIYQDLWEDPRLGASHPGNQSYELTPFLHAMEELKRTRRYIISHADAVHPAFAHDESGALLHEKHGYLSFFWFPFDFREDGFYLLIFNQVTSKKEWSGDEIEFIEVAAHLVNIALQKIRLIAERALAEQEALKHSKAVMQSPLSIIMTDKDGIIEFANPKFTAITGYSLDDVVGRRPSILKSGLTPARVYQELWETITAGNEWKGEFRNKKKDGELFWESVIIAPIRNKAGITTNYIAIKEDITDKKLLIRELIAARDKAEAMNRLKSSFLANMSHELRTPLIGIIGFAEILSGEISDEKLRSMLEVIYNSGIRLSETLNSILDLSKAEANKYELKLRKVSLVDASNQTLLLFSSATRKKNLSFELVVKEADVYATVDERLFVQIISNILNNAIKFTGHGGITVTIGREVIDDCPYAYFKVADTGIGIPQEKIPLIFEEFRQASEGLGRSYEGVGLGLTIAKKDTELMQGKIKVESTPGEGAAFTVYLPEENTTGPVAVAAFGSDYAAENPEHDVFEWELPRVLCLDDDETTLDLIKFYTYNRCQLDTAMKGPEALQLAKKTTYDLFLIDINLGRGMNGLQVVKELREMPMYKNTPIVAVTAYSMVGDREEFLSGGCTHYLSKPFLKEDFLGLLNIIIPNRE
jgi:PAS domain S-box-containing protein